MSTRSNMIGIRRMSVKQIAAQFAICALAVTLTACGADRKLDKTPGEAGDSALPEQGQQMKLDIAVRDALSAIPYFGDPAKCTMSVEQATAYAQLLADGRQGKVPVFDWENAVVGCASLMDEDVNPVWDRPFLALGYGEAVETTRGHARLCDLAGDGQPYLMLESLEEESDQGYVAPISLFGWHNGELKRLVEIEGSIWIWYDFGKDENGKILFDMGSKDGYAATCGTVFHFEDGDIIENLNWREWFDEDADLYRREENGVEVPVDPEELGSGLKLADSGVCETDAVSLKDMIDALNGYITAKSGGRAPLVENPVTLEDAMEAVEATAPAKRTDVQNMAKTMVEQMERYNNLSYAKLLDMDGDGTKELILGDDDIGAMRGAVYCWRNQQLQRAFEGFVLDGCVYLVRASNGEYGIDHHEQQSFADDHKFSFLTHTEFYDLEGGDGLPYHYFRDGEEISESEFENGIAQYERVEYIHNWYNPVESHIDETKAELKELLMG